jgi:hypothetical protein
MRRCFNGCPCTDVWNILEKKVCAVWLGGAWEQTRVVSPWTSFGDVVASLRLCLRGLQYSEDIDLISLLGGSQWTAYFPGLSSLCPHVLQGSPIIYSLFWTDPIGLTFQKMQTHKCFEKGRVRSRHKARQIKDTLTMWKKGFKRSGLFKIVFYWRNALRRLFVRCGWHSSHFPVWVSDRKVFKLSLGGRCLGWWNRCKALPTSDTMVSGLQFPSLFFSVPAQIFCVWISEHNSGTSTEKNAVTQYKSHH